MEAIEIQEHIIKTAPPKYKIQDLIACNQGLGHIIGMQPCKTFSVSQRCLDTWDRRFPGFLNEYVYLVMFDYPQRPLTFEEFVDCNTHVTEELLRERYEEIPLVPYVMCPEQEVILEWES